eukprot:SAG31_NODE_1064_length_10098_cov_3.617462_6_plen_948_part_00
MFTPDAYLKDPWNKLDFVVVCGSTLTYMGGNAGFVRLLRCLRPLRIINKNAGMKVIIMAVVDSLGVNVGVLALAGMGILIFAILGVNLFAGQFYQCSCTHAYPAGITPANYTFDQHGGFINSYNEQHSESIVQAVKFKSDCIGETGDAEIFGIDPNFPNSISKCYWDNRPYNFDNCANAMMALFTASTLAGWTDIMEIAMDIGGIDVQPEPFQSWWWAIYFIFYVLVMAFFVTNLFIGVLIDFISHSDGSALLTEDQQKLLDMKKFQKLHRPAVRETAPANSFRKWFYGLVESNIWSNVSSTFIVFNVVVMMCEYEKECDRESRGPVLSGNRWVYEDPCPYTQTLELMNNICLYFFTVEMLFKLIGYFPLRYWKDGWHKFDAVVIILSWVAIIVDLGSVQAIRALRTFRIVLVLKSAKGLRSLFQTLLYSVYPATNITVLLILLYSFYAVMGMQLFGHAPLQDIECSVPPSIDYVPPWYCDPLVDFGVWSDSFGVASGGRPGQMLMGANRQYTHHSSFRSFPAAIKLLFQVCAGQDWKFVMYAVGGEPGRNGPKSQQLTAFLYFCSLFFLSNYILLNLFIATILDSFSSSMREQELDISEEDFEFFKYTFREKASEKTPDLIPYTQLYNLLVQISERGSHDEDGNHIESPLAPPLLTNWDTEATTAWKLSLPQSLEDLQSTDARWIKPCLEKLWEEEGTPLKVGNGLEHLTSFDGPGGFWELFVSTPLVFKQCDASVPVDHTMAQFHRRQGGGSENDDNMQAGEEEASEREEQLHQAWLRHDADGSGSLDKDEVRAILVEMDFDEEKLDMDDIFEQIDEDGSGECEFDEFKAWFGKPGVVSTKSLKHALQTMRFRINFARIVKELEFHNCIYVDEDSTLKYDHVLQALVNNKLGASALSLEEQRKRGLIAKALDRNLQPVSGDPPANADNPPDGEVEFSNPVAKEDF